MKIHYIKLSPTEHIEVWFDKKLGTFGLCVGNVYDIDGRNMIEKCIYEISKDSCIAWVAYTYAMNKKDV